MNIDPQSADALAAAVQRDLLHDIQRAAEAGFTPSVVGVHRAPNGVAVQLKLQDGVHVERELRLDPQVST